MKHITKFKRLFSGVLSAVMAVSAVPIVSVHAEENSEPYPYTMFASSSDDGAITVNADNFCVNGNVATNGTIISGGNVNVNGTKTESAEESMIFIFDKIDNQYFSNSNVDEQNEDYILDEINININVPTEVQGEATLTGNININNALKALEDVNLYGEVKNTNDSVIFSKYGDIVIDSQNVNLNGLVYAPFGSVTINAQNLNLNNVVIIAESIVLTCPSVNANNSSNASSFVGTTSEPLDIPYDEWQYMKDENENDFPDFFENYENWLLLKDTDGDMLPDCVEQFLGTDSNLTDTDGDMLDDYYEVFVTGTDPTLTDTDNNGIADGEEDFDIDGLTNYQEYVQGTSPWNSDSDNDNLSDGDEVNNYGTNPLEPDTDFDGLNDADEIALGTNPNLPDTDGNGIIDSEEKFEQTYVYDVENEDCAVEQVIVSMEGTGNLQSTMSVENIMDKDVICSGVVGLVGVPFSIETTSDFETATLSFKIDQSKLGDTGFNDLLFLWYDEDNYQFVELNTTYDEANSLVSVQTTHFSRYMVVDKYQWYEAWAVELNYNPAEKDSHAPTFKYNTVLAIDCSGSMDSNDKIGINSGINSPYEALFPKTCQRIESATEFIQNMNSMDKTAVVLFTSNASTAQSMTDNKEDLKLSLQKITSDGGTSFYAALTEAYNAFEESSFSASYTNNRIILLSDGEDGSYSSTLNLINSIYKKDSTDKRKSVKIYTIGLGSSYDSKLEEIANISHGEFFKAYTASDLVDIYAEIGIGGDFDKTDTDGDKLYDAVETAGIRLQNGYILRECNPNDDDTDNDDLKDGEEIVPTPIKSNKTIYNEDGTINTVKGYYFVMKSNPTEEDSDGDGLYDGKSHYLTDQQFTMPKDPDPLDKTYFPHFGTEEYKQKTEQGYESVEHQIIHMMNTVNKCKYTDLVTDEDWLKFCEYFNMCVEKYGSIYKELHYFRLKLNRTPESFKELVNNSQDWYLYDKKHTRYHMNNNNNDINGFHTYVSSNSDYPSYSTYWNEYNLKFVDKYGMNEVVVTPNKDLNGMSNEEIYNYLTDATHWQILTDDYEKAQKNPNFKYDPVNVGTYNYSAYDFNYVNLDGTKKETSSSKHNEYDVYPYLGGKKSYSNWGNVPGLIYGNTKAQRDVNEDYYKQTANLNVFSFWNNLL